MAYTTEKRSNGQYARTGNRKSAHHRRGAILSVELLLILPLLLGIFFAAVEFGLLMYSHQQLQNGCREACRVATLPGADREVIEDALDQGLQWKILVDNYTLEELTPGLHTGDAVQLQISVPMQSAAPDLLRFIGFSLRDRKLYARCVMRKE